MDKWNKGYEGYAFIVWLLSTYLAVKIQLYVQFDDKIAAYTETTEHHESYSDYASPFTEDWSFVDQKWAYLRQQA